MSYTQHHRDNRPEKIFVRANIEEKHGHYGPFFSIGFKAADLIALAEKHTNERGFFNVRMCAKRNAPGQYYMEVDFFNPKQSFAAAHEAADGGSPKAPEDDSPPF